MSEIRKAAHAGAFYPATAAQLGAVVDEAVADLEPSSLQPQSPDRLPANPAPLGVLVPHAGLMYSGRIAARGWASMRPAMPETIVIAGTNHVAGWLRGVAVWPSGPWETPLGTTRVDDGLAARILGLGPTFAADREAHRREHAIEVQLPFLARLLPDAAIVPMTVYLDSVDDCLLAGAALGRLIAGERAAGRRIGLAISSDFAHYPAEGDARRVDRLLLECVETLDAQGLAERESSLRASSIPGLVCGMCGIEAALFGLEALRAMGAERGAVLAEATSADVGGDPGRTVGYAAVAFS